MDANSTPTDCFVRFMNSIFLVFLTQPTLAATR